MSLLVETGNVKRHRFRP